MIVPYREQPMVETCKQHFCREDNVQICFERADKLQWKAEKAIAMNLHQEWTLKRTMAKQSVISQSLYSRKGVFNKAERQQM